MHGFVRRRSAIRGLGIGLFPVLGLVLGFVMPARAGDLGDVKQRGTLRHLGIPYANFVTGTGDGMDVELMQGFARELGVTYEYVKEDWGNIFGDLTGRKVMPNGAAFNGYLERCRKDGTYVALVKKYYPFVFEYFPEFFAKH
jgi:ABC-type amino acid transport substrate-binding protein